MAGVSTTSEAHPTSSLAFALDCTPPVDTRVSHADFDEGIRNVNITMERGDSVPDSQSLSDTRAWRYSLDGVWSQPKRPFVDNPFLCLHRRKPALLSNLGV